MLKSIKALGLGFLLGKVGTRGFVKQQGRPPPASPAEPTLQLWRALGQPVLSFSYLPSSPPSVTPVFISDTLALLVQTQLPKTQSCPYAIYRDFTQPFNHLPSNTPKPETNTPTQHLPHPTALFKTKLVTQQPASSPIITFQLQNTPLNTRVCPNHN